MGDLSRPLSVAEILQECNVDELRLVDAGILRNQRDLHRASADTVIGVAEGEMRQSLSDKEHRTFEFHARAAKAFDEALTEAEAPALRAQQLRRDLGGGGSQKPYDQVFRTSGDHTYSKEMRQGASWARDMLTVGLNRPDAPEALDRLRRNQREVALETRALSTTDGAGGDFVPPLWMVQQYVSFARAQRVTANLVRNEVLPAGTDTVNIPRLTGGTAVAEQATQNNPVQNTDATTDAVTAAVTTLAGQQVVSVQMIEQSPINVDDILLGDLLADYAQKVDVFVLNNSATNKKGLLQAASTNSVAYTSASPTVPEFYPKLADGSQQITTSIFANPSCIVMHPRRWAWILAAVDSTNNRPLVVPHSGGPYNSLGAYNGPASAAGLAGEMLGLPVYLDANIPTNLGVGTNQDTIIVMKADESILWEQVPRAEVFREPKADQLSVLLRVYNYVAFTAARRPASISVIDGTGLVAPTF